jgi:glycine betaine/proline transport system substrate-binding protein
VFDGVATGELDLFLDVWLPGTHAEYWDEYGDDVVDLGIWYEPATLELTVPQYVVDEHGIESLEDLAENPDVLDGEIVGIEPGAGMMEILQDEEDGVLVTYGMEDDFEVLESSTPAMRSELAAAIEAEEPIVVTLWSPHPDYALHDLHRLEDPEGAWGEEEQLHAIARQGFDEDFPEVTTWLENFFLEDDDGFHEALNHASLSMSKVPLRARSYERDGEGLVISLGRAALLFAWSTWRLRLGSGRPDGS